MKKTLLVNLLGAPSAGKSTFAYGIMMFLKIGMIGKMECEYTGEYAKDVVFEENFTKLENQIYIFGKQLQRIMRIDGKVDVIVTDSPLILSSVYDKRKRETLKKIVIEEFSMFECLNFFIHRKHPYSQVGRYQNETESDEIKDAMLEFMKENQIVCKEISSDISNIVDIMHMIKDRLNVLCAGEMHFEFDTEGMLSVLDMFKNKIVAINEQSNQPA